MKFSEKLIELRKLNGLSQEELGNKINVSRQAISKWESEQAKPEADKVKELSNVFNVSIDYLLKDEIEAPQETEYGKKRNIKNIIIKILLSVILIYLFISIYKFTILFIYSIKANNIADYQNYNIGIGYQLKDNKRNEFFEEFEEITFSNNIEISIRYDNELENDASITYMNSKEKIAYVLNYDYEIGKYIYEDLEKLNEDNLDELYKHTTIKDITKESIPNSIGEIVLCALNPKTSVKFDGEFLIIKNNADIVINKKTGILDKIYIEYDNGSFSEINYEYNFDDRFVSEYYINQEYLKELEYIMAE